MPRNSINMFDEAKTKQLILYLASRVDIGKTKLMKLLYLIDFIAYEKTGKPITNDTYEHWNLGPVPKNTWRKFNELTSEMITKETQERATGKYHKFVPKTEVDLSVFSKTELEIIDLVINEYGNLYQQKLVDMVHQELPYKITKKDEVIPYYLASYRNHKKLTKAQLAKLRTNKAYIKRLRDAYKVFKSEQAQRAFA